MLSGNVLFKSKRREYRATQKLLVLNSWWVYGCMRTRTSFFTTDSAKSECRLEQIVTFLHLAYFSSKCSIWHSWIYYPLFTNPMAKFANWISIRGRKNRLILKKLTLTNLMLHHIIFSLFFCFFCFTCKWAANDKAKCKLKNYSPNCYFLNHFCKPPPPPPQGGWGRFGVCQSFRGGLSDHGDESISARPVQMVSISFESWSAPSRDW